MTSPPKTEEDIINYFRRKLSKRELRDIAISNSTSTVPNLLDLVGERGYLTFYDDGHWYEDWRHLGNFLKGIRPDLVIRSSSSSENRILIEAKVNEPINRYGIEDSQIVRYFLHLLATITSPGKDSERDDIKRAVLLAAPSSWFDNDKLVANWKYFVKTFKDLAVATEITLGEVRCDDIGG